MPASGLLPTAPMTHIQEHTANLLKLLESLSLRLSIWRFVSLSVSGVYEQGPGELNGKVTDRSSQ